MKTLGEGVVEVQLHCFFSLSASWGEWSKPRTGRFTPGKDTHFNLYKGLGGTQERSGRLSKISPPPGFDPWTLQTVASRYTDYAIPAHTFKH
jgi:hypothetical protein